MNVTDYIRKRLFGLNSKGTYTKIPDYDTLKVTEWSTEFEMYMRNRLIMGPFRYCLLHDPNRPDYDYTTSMLERIKVYIHTGNAEQLVDVANMCMLEFLFGKHPKKHFRAKDDSIHTKLKK